MELKKKIKKMGNSAVILITAEEMELYNLAIGDIIFVDIETEKDRDNKEKANSRLAGTTGGRVKTAEEKKREKEIIAMKKGGGKK